MEPTNSDRVTDQPQTGVPEKRPRFSRKSRIVLIVAAVIVVGGILFALSLNNKDQNNENILENVYYDREGFDRSKLSSAIGDPAPLVTKIEQKAVSYKGAKVVQACNLLTVEEIREQDLQLSPNSTTAFERTFFDGQSGAALDTLPSSLASMDDGNNCFYPLHQPKGTIGIDVYQPAYNQPSAIDYELDRYQAHGSIAGMTRYERTVEDSKSYLLRDGNSAVLLDLRGISDKNLSEKFVAAVAANYKREKSTPKGPIQFAYESPLFQKPYLNGCSITRAADVEKLFNIDAKPLVTERIASAIGVINYSLPEGPSPHNYIEHDCVRQATSNGFSNRKSLTAETTSFLSSKAAEIEMASSRQLDENVGAVPDKIGDDVYFSDTTGNNPEMVIRKGRFVIHLSLFDQRKTNMSREEMIQRLTPTAKLLIERIKGV